MKKEMVIKVNCIRRVERCRCPTCGMTHWKKRVQSKECEHPYHIYDD